MNAGTASALGVVSLLVALVLMFAAGEREQAHQERRSRIEWSVFQAQVFNRQLWEEYVTTPAHAPLTRYALLLAVLAWGGGAAWLVTAARASRREAEPVVRFGHLMLCLLPLVMAPLGLFAWRTPQKPDRNLELEARNRARTTARIVRLRRQGKLQPQYASLPLEGLLGEEQLRWVDQAIAVGAYEVDDLPVPVQSQYLAWRLAQVPPPAVSTAGPGATVPAAPAPTETGAPAISPVSQPAATQVIRRAPLTATARCPHETCRRSFSRAAARRLGEGAYRCPGCQRVLFWDEPERRWRVW